MQYNSGFTNGATIGANYKVNKQQCSLWDGLIESSMLCRIAIYVMLSPESNHLPYSVSLYFLSLHMA